MKLCDKSESVGENDGINVSAVELSDKSDKTPAEKVSSGCEPLSNELIIKKQKRNVITAPIERFIAANNSTRRIGKRFKLKFCAILTAMAVYFIRSVIHRSVGAFRTAEGIRCKK